MTPFALLLLLIRFAALPGASFRMDDDEVACAVTPGGGVVHFRTRAASFKKFRIYPPFNRVMGSAGWR